jgi:hypothetical protein
MEGLDEPMTRRARRFGLGLVAVLALSAVGGLVGGLAWGNVRMVGLGVLAVPMTAVVVVMVVRRPLRD